MAEQSYSHFAEMTDAQLKKRLRSLENGERWRKSELARIQNELAVVDEEISALVKEMDRRADERRG